MILGSIIVFLFVLMFVGVFYAVNAYGIMKLMEAKGYDQLYRAWVPFLNMYFLGEIVEEEIGGHEFVFPGYTKWILALYPLTGAVPFLGNVAAVAGHIYTIVVCCIMADKYKTTVSMIVSAIFGFPGIGYSIMASRMSQGDSYTADNSTQTAETQTPVVTDFSVEAADEKSAPEAAAKRTEPIVGKPETKGTVIGVPEQQKAQDVEFDVVAPVEEVAPAEEPVAEGPAPVEAEPVVIDAAPEFVSDEEQEFDIPLAENTGIIEIEVEE